MLIDAIVRLLPGVLNDQHSALEDSFVNGLLDHPHYTRPESIAAGTVPGVLLSGNHLNITRWRRQQAVLVTARKRPDLLRQAQQDGRLTESDLESLNQAGLGSMLNSGVKLSSTLVKSRAT
jgi:tRNA (guanine37-N1)-methyltransferase